MKYDIIIGIDPDVDKSGIGVVNTKNKTCKMCDASFPALMDFLQIQFELQSAQNKSVLVVVEAGWLNQKKSWHGTSRDSRAIATRLGYDVGRNHEVGILICEMLKAKGIPYIEKKPLKKIWKGSDGKITHEEIVSITGCKEKRSNQEKRDALLLAWDETGFPMRIKVK